MFECRLKVCRPPGTRWSHVNVATIPVIDRVVRVGAIRPGVSLIELMLVFGVISILMGLLLPAVQMVRESARQRSCMNHCRQLAIANQNYTGVHQKFPATRANARWDSQEYLADRGLFVVLLPYVDLDSLYQAFDTSTFANSPRNQSARAEVPRIYRCPSGLGLAELTDVSERFDGDGIAGNLAWTMEYKGAGGVFDGLQPSTGRASKGATGVRLSQVRDGLSNTILGWESSGDRSYRRVQGSNGMELIATSFPDMPGFCIIGTDAIHCTTKPASVASSVYSWVGLGTGLVYGFEENGRRTYPNLPGLRCINMSNTFGTPFSHHPGGVHVWMCDGATRFVSEEVDSQVFSRAVIIADGQINDF